MKLDDEIAELYRMMREALLGKKDRAWAEFFYKRLRKEFCIDIIPDIELPWPHRFVHPLGTVLGRATYAKHLVVYQNVGVGSNLKRERPVFTGPCVLFPGAKVLGRSVIGKNVYITANTVVNDVTVPDNCVVFGQASPQYEAEYGDLGSKTTHISELVACRPTSRRVEVDFFSELRPPTPESLAALGITGP